MLGDLPKKVLTNFEFDYSLVSTPNLSLFEKSSFLWNKYWSIFLNRREISYFGKSFCYDNRFSPAVLEGYPKEIAELDKVVRLSEIRSVLDIGANIGQFAFTLKSLFPQLFVYCFEPNSLVYPVLLKNLSKFEMTKVYDFGLSDKSGEISFYFSPSASPEGSIYRENMNQNYHRGDVVETKVNLIKLTSSDLIKFGIPSKVDLVKVDVEGAEMKVLESLKVIDFDYLYIEVSVNREGGGSLEAIRSFLKKEKGVEPKLVYYSRPKKDSSAANAIFSMK